jgi:hypothetical protein
MAGRPRQTITLHEGCPAICVKVYTLPVLEESEAVLVKAYNLTVKDFWEAADTAAHKHLYSGVFSQGRSGGWLVPYTQHNSAGDLTTEYTGSGPGKGYPVYPNMDDYKEYRQFLRFKARIEKLLTEVPTMYKWNVHVFSALSAMGSSSVNQLTNVL